MFATVLSAAIFFKDLNGHWASQTINELSNVGVFNGYPDGTFLPDNPVTREEFAKTVVAGFNLEMKDITQSTFSDVTFETWSLNFVETAKDYLTGYFPPNGQPYFNPEGYASREDIAVALVKVAGLENHSLSNPDLLETNFSDPESVSPKLRKLMAIAVEMGLIKGYPDGTVRGQSYVTRAETAELLARALKDAYFQVQGKPILEVSHKIVGDQVLVFGYTNKNAKVSINGKGIKVEEGKFSVVLKIEDNSTLRIKAWLPNGQVTLVTKKINILVSAPVLTVNIPETSEEQVLSIRGTVTDKSDPSPRVWVNDEEVTITQEVRPDWTTEIQLEEGSNEITIKAVNKFGKITTFRKTVEFIPSEGLILTINAPETTSSELVQINGTIEDNSDPAPKLYLNGQEITLTDVERPNWTIYGILDPGTNILSFEAVNKDGKTKEIEVKIEYLQVEQ